MVSSAQNKAVSEQETIEDRILDRHKEISTAQSAVLALELAQQRDLAKLRDVNPTSKVLLDLAAPVVDLPAPAEDATTVLPVTSDAAPAAPTEPVTTTAPPAAPPATTPSKGAWGHISAWLMTKTKSGNTYLRLIICAIVGFVIGSVLYIALVPVLVTAWGSPFYVSSTFVWLGSIGFGMALAFGFGTNKEKKEKDMTDGH